MIKMIFESGYIYYMTESEYKVLIGLAGLGMATIITSILILIIYLVIKVLKK